MSHHSNLTNNSTTDLSFADPPSQSHSTTHQGKRTMRMRSLQGQTIGNGRKKKGAAYAEENEYSSVKTHPYDGHVAPFLESKSIMCFKL